MQKLVEKEVYKNPEELLFGQKVRVVKILEEDFGLTRNDASRRANLFFSPRFSVKPYFYMHSPRVIAYHIMTVTKFLDSNNEFVSVESDNGSVITYFCNVSFDVPDALFRLFKQNTDVELNGFSSVMTVTGYRTVTFYRYERSLFNIDEASQKKQEEIHLLMKNTKSPYVDLFLSCLPSSYLIEEIYSGDSRRILEHLRLFASAMEHKGAHIGVMDAPLEHESACYEDKVVLNLCIKSANEEFTLNLLDEARQLEINITRASYHQFHLPEGAGAVKVYTLYLSDKDKAYALIEKIQALKTSIESDGVSQKDFEHKISDCIRVLSDKQLTWEDCLPAFTHLKEVVAKNVHKETAEELNNFYINALSDFLQACEVLGIQNSFVALRRLISYESVKEFFVEGQKDGYGIHKTGYRLRHSSVRGPGKGGLRIHHLAEFSEVGALAFMMTWKCAKAKILFGGGKGGVTMSPKEFTDRSEFDLTVSNFGKSLFLETGPFLDVPAGDVNCGGREIGRVFEGLKVSLRDLVSLAYGSRSETSRIGRRIVSVKQARRILRNNFAVNPYDEVLLERIMTDEKYLNLVIAAQITGKPKLGVNVRGGATGHGMVYCLLAAVGVLYLEGHWEATEAISAAERKLLEKVSELGEKILLEDTAKPFLTDAEWEELTTRVYPKLLKDKRVVLQGVGNVGMSSLTELEKFGVNLVGVADSGGAIIGDRIQSADLLSVSQMRRSVIRLEKNVKRVLQDMKERVNLVTYDCDILLPCALENAITSDNAKDVKAKVIVCGANGPITPKASEILEGNGVLEVYDFLANGGGVVASYFEWLRGLAERYRYEAEEINGLPFDVSVLDNFIMPEFKERMKAILTVKESPQTDIQWELILRDIMIAAFNDDYRRSAQMKTRMKIAGFTDSILRVLASDLLQMPFVNAQKVWEDLPAGCRQRLTEYFKHPELADEKYQAAVQALLS